MSPTNSPGPWEVQPPTLIETIITRGLPYLDAESANKEVIRLTLENMVLQARVDARLLDVSLWDDGPEERS